MTKIQMKRLALTCLTLLIFVCLTSPFLTPRALSLYVAVKTYRTPHIAAAYQINNRYFPIVELLQKHSAARVLYINETMDSSWFRIQLFYEAFPRVPEIVLTADITSKIFDLKALSQGTIIASRKEVPQLEKIATRQFIANEYYLYVIK